jgi:hypothetical protein
MQKMIDDAKSKLDFNPDEFVEAMSESIIPEEMRYAIEHPDNLKHIFPHSRQYDKVKKEKDGK